MVWGHSDDSREAQRGHVGDTVNRSSATVAVGSYGRFEADGRARASGQKVSLTRARYQRQRVSASKPGVAFVMLLRHRPPLPLAAFVDSIWLAERAGLPHTRERNLPTGCADIIIPLRQDSILRFDGVDAHRAKHFSGAVVQGPHDRFSVRGMGGPSSVIGVHFKPGGAAAFFAGELMHLRNQTVLLEDVWGSTAVDLRQRLQEGATAHEKIRTLACYLVSKLPREPVCDSLVKFALSAFSAQPSQACVAKVQQASGCGPARFIRRFENSVGLTPKRFARVLRFNALLPDLVPCGPRDWAALANDAGYFDQSHLIHEFKRLSGLTPTGYAPVSADQLSHVAVVTR